MRLSAKPINFINVNSFSTLNQWIIRVGDPNTLYFQLVDLDQAGLRYIAGISQTASVTVTFPSIDDSQIITLIATQDVNDKSIWSINLNQNHKPSSGNVQFSIAEGSTIRRFSALNLLVSEYLDNGSC